MDRARSGVLCVHLFGLFVTESIRNVVVQFHLENWIGQSVSRSVARHWNLINISNLSEHIELCVRILWALEHWSRVTLNYIVHTDSSVIQPPSSSPFPPPFWQVELYLPKQFKQPSLNKVCKFSEHWFFLLRVSWRSGSQCLDQVGWVRSSQLSERGQPGRQVTKLGLQSCFHQTIQNPGTSQKFQQNFKKGN